MAQRGRTTQQSQDTRKTNQAKQPALSLPHQDDCKARIDIKKRTTKYTATKTPTTGVTIDNKSTTTTPPP